MNGRANGNEKGFSLLEVMIATAICSIMCVGTLALMVQIDETNRRMYDRTICFRAAHQAMEILRAEDVDSMLLQDGNTFVATECVYGPQTGKISIQDLGWNGPDNAYLIRVDIPSYGVTLTAVRTRT
jgi:prepilin-type N-terminal cleavage/methylation domain-containing protein